MSDEEIKTIDITQEPQQESVQEGQPKTIKRSGALSNIRTKISEEEIKNNVPAIRLIVEQNYRQSESIDELEDFRDMYYSKKEESAVLREKLDALNSKLILTTTGGILAGFVPTAWSEWGIGITIFVILLSVVALYIGFFKKID